MPSNIELIHGDCMQYMKDMPDKAFDLAIVDPPFRDNHQPTKDMRNNNQKDNANKNIQRNIKSG